MTAHELAKILLAGPDVPVAVEIESEWNSCLDILAVELSYNNPHNQRTNNYSLPSSTDIISLRCFLTPTEAQQMHIERRRKEREEQ